VKHIKTVAKGCLKDTLDGIFEFIRYANKYFDSSEPWLTRISDPERCSDTLFNCVQIIANLSVLLQPFLPFSSEKVFGWLGLTAKWEPQFVPSGYALPQTEILFERIDKKVVDEELAKLRQ
jgi:methionyl-tRNA synthetase